MAGVGLDFQVNLSTFAKPLGRFLHWKNHLEPFKVKLKYQHFGKELIMSNQTPDLKIACEL